MKKRGYRHFLEDMIGAINKIQRFTKDMTFEEFEKNELVFDAVVRNLEVIGEATRHIPETIEKAYSQIPWRQMSGLRNILIHEYFGIDEEIVWIVISKELPNVKLELKKILIKTDKEDI